MFIQTLFAQPMLRILVQRCALIQHNPPRSKDNKLVRYRTYSLRFVFRVHRQNVTQQNVTHYETSPSQNVTQHKVTQPKHHPAKTSPTTKRHPLQNVTHYKTSPTTKRHPLQNVTQQNVTQQNVTQQPKISTFTMFKIRP